MIKLDCAQSWIKFTFFFKVLFQILKFADCNTQNYLYGLKPFVLFEELFNNEPYKCTRSISKSLCTSRAGICYYCIHYLIL